MDVIVVAVVVSVWSLVAMWPVTKGGVVSMSLRMREEADVGCFQMLVLAVPATTAMEYELSAIQLAWGCGGTCM